MDIGGAEREQTGPPKLGRRQFLTGAAAAAAAITVGCSSDPPDRTTAARSGPTTTRKPVDLPGDPFTLGVASGDPLADRVILWTRLAPELGAADGKGGMPGTEVDVAWEVATDDAFADVVAEGVAVAAPRYGHAVHVDATGLAAGTDHWYRFVVGTWKSPVGRTRTLADGSPEKFGVGVVNCQMFESGQYGAYRHLAEEDLDLVVHLGDYIYEYPGGQSRRSSLPDRAIENLADYRLRYASYKADPHLQAAHARFPFVCTWDDHEVANNYMSDVLPGTPEGTASTERKAAAYQAWWEHLPVRLDPPDGSDLAVHRDLTIGDLARLYILDERQDAALPPCRPEPGNATDFGDCEARDGEDRTRLGKDQEAWLTKALDEGGVTWNLLGNPVVLAGIDAGSDAAAYYLDTWDGFPDARRRLIAQLAEVTNPVVLTGDYHAGMALDVHAEPFDQTSKVVAPEFMAPPISSVLFAADVTGRTPQLREQINAHGYLAVEVTPERLTARFRTVDDVADADTGITTASTWTVDAGNPVATKA
jgi:alkaline phosphatase D